MKYGRIIHYWNYSPAEVNVIISIGSILGWIMIMFLFKGNNKNQIIFNRLLLVIDIVLVVTFTISMRSRNETAIICLTPFNALLRGRTSPTNYKQIWINILMFLPLGMSLPSGFKFSWKQTVAVGFVFSVCIELIQFIAKMGVSEIDDVLANTLGVIIGVVCCNIVKKFG